MHAHIRAASFFASTPDGTRYQLPAQEPSPASQLHYRTQHSFSLTKCSFDNLCPCRDNDHLLLRALPSIMLSAIARLR